MTAMNRRRVLSIGAGLGASLALPSYARAQGSRTLRLIPNGDLSVLDPHASRADVTRNHAFAVYDTLYGLDGSFQPQPQMLEGHTVEEDGRLWRLTLRPGLVFHDGESVLARDCVASIKRWAARDDHGKALMSVTDELSAPDDRTIQFRLSRPFPLLPAALGKAAAFVPVMMPERIASIDAFTAITEAVGSGPFRFKADEYMAGNRVVYERFEGYKPRESGTPAWTAGPKIVHLDRLEWLVMPDPATAASALQSGEADWWESGVADLLPLFRDNDRFIVERNNPIGSVQQIRINHLHPPFDSPVIRKAIWQALNQRDFMLAVNGSDETLFRTGIGFFPPESPAASRAGLEILERPRDIERARSEIAAAGYDGTPITTLIVTNNAVHKAMGDVGMDLLQKLGFRLDVQTMDLNTRISRSNRMEPPSEGGWNIYFTGFASMDVFDPLANGSLRGNGRDGVLGWATSPRLNELHGQWISAGDKMERNTVAEQIQLQAFEDAPYYPIGQSFIPAVRSSSVRDRVPGFAVFWNVSKI